MTKKLLPYLAVILLTSNITWCQKHSAPLIGVWKMVADQEVDSSGRVIAEDTTVRGLLIYTIAGKMSAQTQWPKVRRPIMTDSIMNGDGISFGVGAGNNSWSNEQRGILIDSYDAYFGDYSVDTADHIVTHILTANLRPEKPGTVFRRRYRLTGDTLYLRSADPLLRWQMKCIRIRQN